MDWVDAYLVVALSVFAVNLLPAFGPPTWAVLVLWYRHGGLTVAGLVAWAPSLRPAAEW